MFQKVSVNLNRFRFPASLKSFFSIGYYCMQRKAIPNSFIFQVNNIAFHPVHCCLLATVGSDGKFSFWDKDARTKLKVCTHLYFGRLDARPVICFYTPYGIVSFCRSLKFYQRNKIGHETLSKSFSTSKHRKWDGSQQGEQHQFNQNYLMSVSIFSILCFILLI